MNIHDFMRTVSCSLVVGLLLGYFFREALLGFSQFMHRHLEPRHLRRYRPTTPTANAPSNKDDAQQ